MQLVHSPPPAPHAAALDATQAEPFQQLPAPQQLPALHWPVPPPHDVPSTLARDVQAPPEQLSVVHSLLSSQLRHTAPPVPQAAPFVPASQELVLLSTQPVQQVPAKHRPPPVAPAQGEPSGALSFRQAPPKQLSFVQGFPSLHDWQKAPAEPHALTDVPALQLWPSQHPSQQSPV